MSTNALAEQLGLAAPSVTSMVKRLAGLGLLEHRPYGGVWLTGKGRKVALEIIRHHRLIETYLQDKLGLAWDEVHEEAEELEHVLSERLERRVAEALGHPSRDPHGDPIPGPDGRLELSPLEPLAELGAGQRATVVRVASSDPEVLRYLGGRGITPRASLLVRAVEPFLGPLTVELDGRAYVLGRELAGQIFVEAHA